MTRASSLGCLEPALVERMVALVRDLAGGIYLSHVNEKGITTYDAVLEAQAIAAELPASVDPDWRHAEALAFKHGYGRIKDDCSPGPVILAAIKRGRQLAQPDASNEA